MTAMQSRDLERIDELLADQAAADIAVADERELDELLERNPVVDRDEFLRVAGIAQVAFLRQARRRSNAAGGGGGMPVGLRERLAARGEAVAIRQQGTAGHRGPAPAGPRSTGPASSPSRPTPAEQRAARRWSPAGMAGWALAAALAVAFVVVRSGPGVTPDAAVARASLLADAPDVIRLPWAPPTAPGYEKVSGDVVWSESRQQGYLRLANMPVNDPARTQYQLWIVDPGRDVHPVDGGVFNVSASSEVIVPIHAKLPVVEPKAFAITAEKPGGVVVSAGPLLVVAST